MAALSTIDETIDIGDVGTGLANSDAGTAALFGNPDLSPNTAFLIAFNTDALRWLNEGDPTDDRLRANANYVLWLCRKFRNEAQNLINGGGGGSVVPGGGGSSTSSQFPLYIKSTSFTNSTDYDNPILINENLAIFVNEINRYIFFGDGFLFTATGIRIRDDASATIPGFDAQTQDWNMVIENVQLP